jgi:Outer membrane protein/protective antigen OMA87
MKGNMMQKLMSLLLSVWLLFLNPVMIMAAEPETANPDDAQLHWVSIPLFYQSPESGIALGGLFMEYRNPDAASTQGKQNTLGGMFFYTQKKQVIGEIDLQQYFQGDRILMTASIGYIDFSDEFYGIGADTNENMEEDYTFIERFFAGSIIWKVAPDFYVGPYLTYRQFAITDQAPEGLLASGEITGSDGTRAAGGGLRLLWDTRDDAFMPRHGWVMDAKAMSYRKDWGSDEDFSQLELTCKYFWPFGTTGTLALMSLTTLSDGNVPFEMMPCLGGSTIMRGYYSGYYRDNDYAAVQAEYRFPISGSFSGVIFTGFGEVAPEIDNFRVDHIKATAGFGLRYQLIPDQKIKLRLDIGFSENGVESYLNLMEAF